jgi:hypothetical protein
LRSSTTQTEIDLEIDSPVCLLLAVLLIYASRAAVSLSDLFITEGEAEKRSHQRNTSSLLRFLGQGDDPWHRNEISWEIYWVFLDVTTEAPVQETMAILTRYGIKR